MCLFWSLLDYGFSSILILVIMSRRRMMMASKIDTTTDVLLHLDNSLVNAVNNASPSASYNTGTLNYTAAKFDNGITSTLSTANSNPTVLEFDLPYNAYGGKHDFTIEFWIKVSSSAANINGVGIGKAYTTISKTNILRVLFLVIILYVLLV